MTNKAKVLIDDFKKDLNEVGFPMALTFLLQIHADLLEAMGFIEQKGLMDEYKTHLKTQKHYHVDEIIKLLNEGVRKLEKLKESEIPEYII